MSPSTRPIVFGEVLFDRFPDGSEVLGGAPFNVAWHLAAFGHDPLLITRIGADEPGRRVLDAMVGHGMDVSAVQRDPDAPTGTVRVLLGAEGPGFEIPSDQAFDRIDAGEALAATRAVEAALLYHGSLAVRAAASAAALDALRERLRALHFVDVNLRAPWWERAAVLSLCRRAAIVKLNDDELHALAGRRTGSPGDLARELAADLGCEWLVVTRGAGGALLVTGRGEPLARRPPEDVDVVDTVGAGDAFAAVTIAGRLRGWSEHVTLARAVEFAARICGIRGAVPGDPGFYERTLADWRAHDA